MYGKTKDYAIECGHAIKIVPLLEVGCDQKAALEAIFEVTKRKKRKY